MLRLCAGAIINTSRCLCWEQQGTLVDQQSVRGGHWIWWITSMGEILHLAVIHRQMFVVVCLRCRQQQQQHCCFTNVWRPSLQRSDGGNGTCPRAASTQAKAFPNFFNNSSGRKGGGGGGVRHVERREKAWHRDQHIKTSVIASRPSYCLPQHFSQLSIFSVLNLTFLHSPTLSFIHFLLYFCELCSACSYSFCRRFFGVVWFYHFYISDWMAAARQSKVIPVNSQHVKQRAEFIAIAVCSADTVLQHQTTKEGSW